MIMEKAVWRRGEVMARLGISKRAYYDLIKAGMLRPRRLPSQRRKGYITASNLKEVEDALAGSRS